jgi:predicted TIM-barrel fold metal-dependent hydrolase
MAVVDTVGPSVPSMSPKRDMPIIDIDQHYYEPVDCCSRHLESRFKDQAVHVAVGEDGRPEWRFGEVPLQIERHPRHITAAPGELELTLGARDRGESRTPKLIDGTAPEYTDRNVRVKLLDEWGIEAAVIFPSSGLAFDAQISHMPDAACAATRAFNRWIEEDWGFNYQGRIFAAPFISLQKIGEAVNELERVLALGARVIQIRLGPVNGKSPAHPDFDPFWARIDEAGVPVALHITLSGYEQALSELWGENAANDHVERSGFQWYLFFATRPAMDTFAALVFHNLFGRFPNLKIISVENGSKWVGSLVDEMDAAFRFVAGLDDGRWIGGLLREHPSEVFRRHVWIAPFLDLGHEAKLDELISVMGVDHVVFGSDWPHAEGRESPRHFDTELAPVSDAEMPLVLHDNSAGLLGLN